MAKVEDIVFIVPIKEGTSQALYLRDDTVVVIDVRTGVVEHVSQLPSQDDIAACKQLGEARRAAGMGPDQLLGRLPLREIDTTDRRVVSPVDSPTLPTGVERRT